MSEIRHLSHSAISAVASCGEKFRLERVVKVPRTPSWALVGGSAVHAATETLDKQDFGLPVDGPVSFAEAFEAEIKARAQESGTDPDSWRASGRASKEWPEKESRKWWLANGPSMVVNWRNYIHRAQDMRTFIWITPDGQPAIELKFETEMFGFPVVGYIDRIMENPNGIFPVDLKSGANMPKDCDQLYLYALAVEEMFGNLPRMAAYYMNRTGAMFPCEVKKDTADRIRYRVETAAKMVKNEIFLPNSSMLCNYCEVRDYCYQFGGSRSAEVRPW